VALFWAQPLWVGVLLALGAYFLEFVVDNIAARLRWTWMLSISWGIGVGLVLLNIVLIQFVFSGARV